MNYLKNILSTLDQHYFGLIWAVDQKEIPLDETFHTVDYLSDGLLTKLIGQDDLNRSKPHLVVSTQFGHPFWIFVVPHAATMALPELEKIIPMAKQLQAQDSHIAILEYGQIDKKIISKIKTILEKELQGCQINSSL